MKRRYEMDDDFEAPGSPPWYANSDNRYDYDYYDSNNWPESPPSPIKINFSPQLPQNFSLPRDSINYILKNFKSIKIYQKLVKTCKYFYLKNSIIRVNKINISTDDEWNIFFREKSLSFSQQKINQSNWKFWIDESLTFYNDAPASNFVKRIFHCNHLHLWRINLSFEDVVNIKNILGLKEFSFYCTNIYSSSEGKEEESQVPLEKVFELFPTLERFSVSGPHNFLITPETAKKIINCPNFKNMRALELNEIPENFDFKTFSEAMEQQNETDFELSFVEPLTEIYRKQLQEYIDKVIKTHQRGNFPPMIKFRGNLRIDQLRRLRLDPCLTIHK